jgi:hypothetical protein
MEGEQVSQEYLHRAALNSPILEALGSHTAAGILSSFFPAPLRSEGGASPSLGVPEDHGNVDVQAISKLTTPPSRLVHMQMDRLRARSPLGQTTMPVEIEEMQLAFHSASVVSARIDKILSQLEKQTDETNQDT